MPHYLFFFIESLILFLFGGGTFLASMTATAKEDEAKNMGYAIFFLLVSLIFLAIGIFKLFV